MNLILLFAPDFVSSDTARLTGRRLRHVLDVLKPQVNDVLTVGLSGGKIGSGRVLELDEEALLLAVALHEAPPPRIPVILCVALMRPIVLKRVLLTAASLGVEEVVLFNSARVEKSFWQSTALSPAAIEEQLILGVEQSKDTVLPKVTLQKRFKPFVEDDLPLLLQGRSGAGHLSGGPRYGIVADPAGEPLLALDVQIPAVIVVGPEGGLVPYEVTKFRTAGCKVVGLGKRILKVETAIVTLLARFG
ncbi:MAG: 16S rRNA (uracil(1498)-N(3))-methyltransferase [Candidatus Omnitrophica bacterium]|nr:16S rRNA (uracil(1498)-N(3))-methyltransferase [Candidatus Omnitrophota bacterium]